MIPQWFIEQNFTGEERYAITTCESVIEKETEKANLLVWNTKFGRISKWIPKSVYGNEKQVDSDLIPCNKKFKQLSTGIIFNVIAENEETIKLEIGKKFIKKSEKTGIIFFEEIKGE